MRGIAGNCASDQGGRPSHQEGVRPALKGARHRLFRAPRPRT